MLSCAKKPPISHLNGAGAIVRHVLAKHLARLSARKPRPFDLLADRIAQLQAGDLTSDLKSPRRAGKHLGELQLTIVKVEPMDDARHDLGRKNTCLQLMFLAKALAQSGAHV